MHIYIYTYIYIHIHTYIHIYVYTYIHIYTYTYIYIYTYILRAGGSPGPSIAGLVNLTDTSCRMFHFPGVVFQRTCICMYMLVYVCIRLYICVYVCGCMYMCVYVCFCIDSGTSALFLELLYILLSTMNAYVC